MKHIMHHARNEYLTDFNRVSFRYRLLEAWSIVRGKTSLCDMMQLGTNAGMYTAWWLFHEYGVVTNPYTGEAARVPQPSQQTKPIP